MGAKWISPFLKQCFVTSGVSINYMTHGLVVGFTAVLIPALKDSDTISVDDDSATWIASIFGISLLLGALTVPSVMNRFGRKPANMFSAALMTVGWLTIALCSNAATLLLARFMQGFSMGFLAILGSILIGECSSPKNRGALLTSITAFIFSGILIVHFLGTIISWQRSSLIFSVISFLDLLIILFSPESPSFLANRGRYDECRKAFHWLRGHDEEVELDKLIKTNMAFRRHIIVNKEVKDSGCITKTLDDIKVTLSKKEVFKPIIIVLHLYAMNQWCGAVTYNSYTRDILNELFGKDAHFSLIIVSVDAQKMISVMIAMIVMTKLRRKLVLVGFISMNLFAFLVITLYSYLRSHQLLSFEDPTIAMVLLHIHSFSQAGLDAITNTIAGEIFPLEHRGLCGMFGIFSFSINETINLKTVPYLLASLGLHGAYVIYASIVTYCSVVAWCMLPETRGRTLLEIEEEFRGKPLFNEDNLVGSIQEAER